MEIFTFTVYIFTDYYKFYQLQIIAVYVLDGWISSTLNYDARKNENKI